MIDPMLGLLQSWLAADTAVASSWIDGTHPSYAVGREHHDVDRSGIDLDLLTRPRRDVGVNGSVGRLPVWRRVTAEPNVCFPVASRSNSA